MPLYVCGASSLSAPSAASAPCTTPSAFTTSSRIDALSALSAGSARSALSAQELSTTRDGSEATLEKVSSEPHEVFNVYYGSVHHHTKHSDGRGSLEEALSYAWYVGGLDFLGLSDHAELIALWPWSNVWARTRAAVDRATQEGVFVAFAGFEWSSPIFGHINVVNSREVAWGGAIGHPSMGAIARFVVGEPTAFAKYNHPGRADFLGLQFEHFSLRRSLKAPIVGIEVADAHDGFDRYHDTDGYRDDDGGLRYIDEAIGRGWWVAPQAELDAHDLTWHGRFRQRTGVLHVGARALGSRSALRSVVPTDCTAARTPEERGRLLAL
ncbi:MAG: hypothetical protein IPK13_27915 [Deltaproteobacteria bacterium]|nr:hypothetical protein [Deltaproteobacteria bacterium]